MILPQEIPCWLGTYAPPPGVYRISDSEYHVPVAVENDAEARVVVAPLRICTDVGVSTRA